MSQTGFCKHRTYLAFLAIALLLVPLLGGCAASDRAQAGQTVPFQGKVEVGFSPDGAALDIILNSIESAEKSILVAAYSFTSKPISLALLEAHRRGVKVRVIADKRSNKGKYSAVTFLANQGVAVRVNGNYQIFHHKFMVFDGRHVETGSFNYSAAAVNKNAENVILIRDSKKIARIYSKQWEGLWKESEVVEPNY